MVATKSRVIGVIATADRCDDRGERRPVATERAEFALAAVSFPSARRSSFFAAT